ncbi:LRR repeats and ubiquitin-like domain-containing protein At2g30105 [Linum perenne]
MMMMMMVITVANFNSSGRSNQRKRFQGKDEKQKKQDETYRCKEQRANSVELLRKPCRVVGVDLEGEKMDPATVIKVVVKFSGRLIPVSVSLDNTIKDIKALLQPLTNVLPRGQKLIFQGFPFHSLCSLVVQLKLFPSVSNNNMFVLFYSAAGKVLADAMTLRELEVSNGAKIMLVASQGLHQGGGPVLKNAASRPISREKASTLTGKGKTIAPDKSQLERWKSTGVIALAECNLKMLPDEIWDCGSSARVLDASNNSLQELPSKLQCLASLKKIIMNGNGISDQSICWEALSTLKYLTALHLSQNQLTVLPKEIGALSSLKQLHVSFNKLNSLPVEIGLLSKLEILVANNNRISTIDPSIGSCISLVEVDLSSNLITDLPESLGNLQYLKALHLGNNGITTLPSVLFKSCKQLSTLDLHNTEITMEVLRKFEGWNDFDERRCLKHQKQLDFRVMGSGEFDEGADKN